MTEEERGSGCVVAQGDGRESDRDGPEWYLGKGGVNGVE